jgi:hypothetical protein
MWRTQRFWLAVGAFVLTWARDPHLRDFPPGKYGEISPLAFYLIQPGMTEEQVKTIFGRAADVTTAPYSHWLTRNPFLSKGPIESWTGKDMYVVILFSAEGKVANKERWFQERSLSERIRESLGF